MNMNYRICRVVDSHKIAKPFINHYQMKLNKKFNLYPIYSDKLNQNWLVISGGSYKSVSFASIYLNYFV